MKKKHMIIFLITVASLIIGFYAFKVSLGNKPFKDLSISEVSEVSVQLAPPDETFELKSSEIAKFINILQTVVTYRQDDSYKDYAGQAVVFTITKTDGSQIVVNAYNPFIIINDIGYKTKYEPCQQLNSFGNDMLRTRELPETSLNLSDGTNVDIIKNSGSISYMLSDGTELLRVKNPSGPDNVIVGGTANFNDLSETAQASVLAYYSRQGLLYDANEVLEQAYADYQHTENKDEFTAYMLSQEISPSASNERILYFITSVYFPIDSQNGQEVRLGAAFDRETGNRINNWELFSCSEEEAKQTLLDIAQIKNSPLREEMESAFSPEYLTFFADNLEISFPAGTLPSQENCYILGLDYDKELCRILNDWAIPQQND